MPHITIEYSANLAARLDVEKLVVAVHEAAIATGVFPLGGTRTRALEFANYAIADQASENGFIHINARIGTGRGDDTKQLAGDQIFAILCAETKALFETSPLALSLEIVETSTWKKNNIHEKLEANT